MNKKVLTIAISSALAAPMVAQAIPFKVSGHINRTIMFADDGIASDVMNVDNGGSRSRITITGSDNLGVGGIKAGVRMEWSVASNLSSAVTIKGRNGNTGGNDIAFDIRHSAIWFSGKFGKLTMGHTSGAYDGKLFADQSGVAAMGGLVAGALTMGGAIVWRTNAGGNLQTNGANTALLNTTAAGAFDGGRHDVVRYDTPSFGPFKAGVSVGDNQRWNFGANIDTSFSGAKIAIAGGYEERTNDAAFDQWGLSGSVLFSQGTNLTVAYAERDVQNALTGADLRSSDSIYLKLGHRWGNNAVAIDYQQVEDLAAANDEHTTWGIGIGHNIPGPNVQIYASYRNHDLDRQGANVEDVDVFAIGSRVRF